MGYSIFLKSDSFDHDGWVQNLDTYGLDISPMGSQLAMILAEHNEDEIWLHPSGGVRGVTVKLGQEGAELSLPTGVSEADFLLAGRLVRAAVALGAVAEDEEGRILTGTDDEMRDLSMTYRQFFWSAISQSIARGETTLPVGGMLNLKIDASERGEAGWDELESKQLAKMARYQEAYIPSLMQVEINGVELILSNYHHLPTLISTQAEYVTLNGEDGNLTDSNPVPADRFLQILADRVEYLGDWIFLPAIDFNAEPELAGKIKAAAGVSASSTLPLPTGIALTSQRPTQTQGESTQGELTGEDWMLLAKSAVYCLLMIAGADGSVDRKEIVTIQSLLTSYQSSKNPALAKILGIAQASMEQIAQELQEEDLPALVHIALLVRVLKKFPDHEAAQIKAGFLAITQAVAESSGGFFGFGSKVSKNEQAVLDFLKSALA